MSTVLEESQIVEPRRVAPRRSPAVPQLRPTRLQRLVHAIVASFADFLDSRRIFVLLPFALLAGLTISAAMPQDAAPTTLVAVGLGIAVVWFLGRDFASVRYPALLLGAVWAGISLLPLHGTFIGTTMLARPVYGTFQVTVDELITIDGTKARVIASSITPMGDARDPGIRRARIAIDTPTIAPGDVFEGKFRFYPVPAPVLPNGFDTQFHAYFDGVGAYGNATSDIRLVAHGAQLFDRLVADVRQGISTSIDDVLGAPAAGIARALINGDQSKIDDDTRNVLAAAGLAHVYSVSGLHLSLVAVLTMSVLRVLLSMLPGIGRYVAEKRVAALGGIIAALGYFAISGGNVAALRSTIMILLVLGAVVFGRRALTMRNVAIAALLVMITDPASAFRPSFQLSFSAVVGLVGAWESWARDSERYTGLWERSLRYLGASALTSAVAGLSTVLFSVYYFQQTSPLGIVANMAVLPIVTIVMMPMAMLGTLLMPFGIAAPCILALGWSIDRMLDIARFIAGLSAGIGWSPQLAPTALLVGLVAYAWFAFFTTCLRYAGPAMAALLIALFCIDQKPDLLVADTTQAIAVRSAAGMVLAAGKSTSFAVRAWQEDLGETISAVAPGQACTPDGCRFASDIGFTLGIARTEAGVHELCGRVDVLVARGEIRSSCEQGLMIGPLDLARRGTFWLRWLAPSGPFEVRTAIDGLSRPWRVQPP
jgi:competence protein ComEC